MENNATSDSGALGDKEDEFPNHNNYTPVTFQDDSNATRIMDFHSKPAAKTFYGTHADMPIFCQRQRRGPILKAGANEATMLHVACKKLI